MESFQLAIVGFLLAISPIIEHGSYNLTHQTITAVELQPTHHGLNKNPAQGDHDGKSRHL